MITAGPSPAASGRFQGHPGAGAGQGQIPNHPPQHKEAARPGGVFCARVLKVSRHTAGRARCGPGTKKRRRPCPGLPRLARARRGPLPRARGRPSAVTFRPRRGPASSPDFLSLRARRRGGGGGLRAWTRSGGPAGGQPCRAVRGLRATRRRASAGRGGAGCPAGGGAQGREARGSPAPGETSLGANDGEPEGRVLETCSLQETEGGWDWRLRLAGTSCAHVGARGAWFRPARTPAGVRAEERGFCPGRVPDVSPWSSVPPVAAAAFRGSSER